MRSASFAEWILARFTTRERAASMIGDLLEAVPQKGKLWFWLSVARVLISLTWRRPLAYVVSYGVAFCWFRAFQFSVVGVHPMYRVPAIWIVPFRYVTLVSACASAGWAYTATRFGFRDLFVRYLIAVSVLTVAVTFFGRLPVVAYACGLLGVCGVIYSVTSAERRKGLLAVLIAVLFNFAFFTFSIPLYSGLGLLRTRIGVRDMTFILAKGGMVYLSRPIAPLWVFTVLSLLVWGFVYARVHRMFFENNSRDSAQLSAEIS